MRRSRARPAVRSLALLVLLSLPALAWGQGPVGTAPRVKDPVLARLVWLVETDFEGSLDRASLEGRESGRTRRTRLPLGSIVQVARDRAAGDLPARVTIAFAGPLDVPFPYGILGYKPGRLRASRTLTLSEWSMGPVTFEGAGPGGSSATLDDLRIFRVTHGSAAADFHGWVDKLLGPALEDTDLQGLFFYRESGSPRGAALGTTPAGEVHIGVFDLERDGAVFPTPRGIKVIAGRLYHWMLRQTNS